ncbi:MAG: BCCT family transporter [Myxococcota bacterium]
MPSETRPSTICAPVFFTSAVLLVAFLAFGVFAADTAQAVLPKVLQTVTEEFGWLYVLSVVFFISFCLWIAFGRYGSVRLGDDDDRPEFSNVSWFAMLFSAGMGIGLVFFGVAEPMSHFNAPPVAAPGSATAAREALPLTYLHWGLHAWAIYALMALGIGYFAFRRKLPIAIRSCFYPLLGERIYGWPGHLVDILAVLGTLFGLATSLGLGATQVSAGLHRLFGVPHTVDTQLVLIGVITIGATVSLVTGVDKGIKRLSEINLGLASLLMLFVFLVGPTLHLVNALVENLGGYIEVFFTRSLLIEGRSETEATWIRGWSVFYWGWWISWAPFVGMFVARISKGRTFRELVLGVLLVPTLVTFSWMTVFGNTALHLQLTGAADIAAAVDDDTATAIYAMLDQLPLARVTSFLAAGVVSIFFITSSDSASFVVDMLTSGGHPDPPRWQRVFWATAEGATAAVLLYAGGQNAVAALKALQAGVITIGLPFCLVLVALAFSLLRGLREERPSRDRRTAPRRFEPLASEEGPMKLGKILVPVDLSPPSARALRHALELSAFAEDASRVSVLHVARRPAAYLPFERLVGKGDNDPASVDAMVVDAAERAQAEFIDDALGGAATRERVSAQVELGIASQTIIERARDGAYDIIVMGTHGRTGAERVLMGSTAERVLRNAPCPVVTVR